MRTRELLFAIPFSVILFPLPFTVLGQAPAAEVSFLKDNKRIPDRDRQAELRKWGGWRAFKLQHPRWSAEFNEETGLPRRAYGDPIPTTGATPVERAERFLADELVAYRLPLEELVARIAAPSKKATYVHFEQLHEGLPVLGARAMVKLDGQHRVISFSADLIKDITVSMVPTLDAGAAAALAAEGLSDVTTHEVEGLAILPVPTQGRNRVRLVHRITVHTRRGDTPGRYSCLVDGHDGSLLYRTNEVRNCGHGEGAEAGVDVSLTATAYTGSPLVPAEVQGLPNLDVVINGTIYRTDVTGSLLSGIPGPVPGLFHLRGSWAHILTNNINPSFTTTLNEGHNAISFDASSNIRQRSAYLYVNQIHAHMKSVLPDFVGLDIVLPTYLDLTTDNCNAFYDGSSINFYAEGNNCRSLATINDVVYHEYGHGINDKFYLSLSSNFTNGAMNEGYADVWGFTLTQDPVLGLGMNLDDPNSSVRRYDGAPKVYPNDITGEVHADGEIIAGAWWDLYELLGEDIQLTLDLFAAAYPGLQANTFNGNEGQAYRDVLLDVLQADDTDGDITNGTTNGGAIVEAFAMHGITLISDAELFHDGLLAAAADESIDLQAQLVISFPSTLYLDGATLFYKVNDATDWTAVAMVDQGQASYTASIPAQPAGTLVAYYLGLRDIFDQSSSITPIAADLADPGLPHYMLVGYGLSMTENADDLNQLGAWVEGQPEDNASTGNWEFGAPVGSYGTPGQASSIVQPNTQHTNGGQYCWFTGNALGIDSPIGDNDVDDGSTTLMGPNIDLTTYVDPAMSYWRWYTNNPPSGANPKADWWQVYASGDNGATWVPVEDTKNGERNWRRKAFRVQDVLGAATQIRLKFIASDSLRPGMELDGGSLVEAAVDDIELWSANTPDGVAERNNARALAVWPSPTQGTITVQVRIPNEPNMAIEVLDLTGRVVLAPRAVRQELLSLDASGLADGQYMVRLRWSGGAAERRFSVLH